MLHYIRRLYSLDTLDTRFTASKPSSLRDPGAGLHTTRSSSVAPEGDAAAREATRSSGISASLWNTTEFYLYYIIFIVVVPLMFKVAIEVSNRKFNIDSLIKLHYSLI